MLFRSTGTPHALIVVQHWDEELKTHRADEVTSPPSRLNPGLRDYSSLVAVLTDLTGEASGRTGFLNPTPFIGRNGGRSKTAHRCRHKAALLFDICGSAFDFAVAALVGVSAKAVRRAHRPDERDRKCPECSRCHREAPASCAMRRNPRKMRAGISVAAS